MKVHLWEHWFRSGDDASCKPEDVHTHAWYNAMWLTGMDYFSSLAFQAGIALLAAGALAPVSTAILVAVTLFCCVPMYLEVAQRSYAGQGSIAMLENLLPGWWGKTFVLVLLGFAGTDFVITMTLCAADAARHATENPMLHPFLGSRQFLVTIVLLVLLALVFLKGFGEAIVVAVAVGVPYVVLNIAVLARCWLEVAAHPELVSKWKLALDARGDWTGIALASVLIFPQLALGLSGFETGVSIMPLIAPPNEPPPPKQRIRNTGKLLIAAALIMGLLLMISAYVTAVLIPEQAYRTGGPASGRAMAYLAHQLLGDTFGSIYDVSTILILWFAGASAMAGLLNLIPRYLPRFGMAPNWVAYTRPVVIVLFIINLIVTIVFHADVDKQGGAYATGVLALILSAAIAASIALWREAHTDEGRQHHALARSLFCCFVALVFAYTLVVNVHDRPDGIIIASIFIVFLITSSVISRFRRSKELRVTYCTFADPHSEELWHQMIEEHVSLIPVHDLSKETREKIGSIVLSNYQVEGPLAFVGVQLMDDRSEFTEQVTMKVSEEGDDYVVQVLGANVIANTLAYIAVTLHARAVFLGLTRKDPLSQALRYFVFGTGETALLVYEILVRYWADKPVTDRPKLFLMVG